MGGHELGFWLALALPLSACAAQSEPPAPATVQRARSCMPGSRYPRDRCNDCYCTLAGDWKCGSDPCVTCPEPEAGQDSPALVTRTWIRNAEGTLCCQYPVRSLPLEGWRGAEMEECWGTLMPGYYRPPRSVLAVELGRGSLLSFAKRSARPSGPALAEIRVVSDLLSGDPTFGLSIGAHVLPGETADPALDRALGRARAEAVRRALIQRGVAPNRIRVAPAEEVAAGHEGVWMWMAGPSPVVGGSKTCTDGVTIDTSVIGTNLERPWFEICRNATCARTRVDLARLGAQGEAGMIFSIPKPLEGGVAVRHHGIAFEIALRINAAKGSLADGDVYRMRVFPVTASGQSVGLNAAAGYATWIPDAPGAKPDACLDAYLRVDLLSVATAR